MDEYTIGLVARPGPALVVVATVWLLGVSGAALDPLQSVGLSQRQDLAGQRIGV
jgi:hypothetical protein